MGLRLVCGTYCTDYLMEGVAPAWYVDSWPNGKQLTQKLINAGFWVDDEGATGSSHGTNTSEQKEQLEIDKAKAKEWKAGGRRRERRRNSDVPHVVPRDRTRSERVRNNAQDYDQRTLR